MAENAGRVALTRGPLLYCLEGVDHPGVDLSDVALPAEAELVPEVRPGLLGGVVALSGEGVVVPPDEEWTGRLYRPEGTNGGEGGTARLAAVPYHAWANREPGPMRVWLRART